jgi:hypothetical protein
MRAPKSGAIRRWRTPAYPTTLEALAKPGLLARHQLPAWLSNREIAAAAGVLLAANAGGCSRAPASCTSGTTLAPGAPAVVAPLFEHGSGRGSVGCIAMNPPEFLSEEEGLQVIREELTRQGLAPLKDNVEFSSVKIPRRYIQLQMREDESDMDETIVEAPEEAQPLVVDLVTPQRHVAVEFVSLRDYGDLGGPQWGRGCWSSACEYDFKDVARSLSEQVRSQAQGVWFGAFYDPLTTPGHFLKWAGADTTPATAPSLFLSFSVGGDKQGAREQATRESKQLLRQQVKDFVDWLKAQGAI